MRALLSLGGLLIVLLIVWQLTSRNLQQAVPPAGGQKTADHMADEMRKAIEQGAAARASEAAAQ